MKDFSETLTYTFDTGDYTCVNCGSKLFTSNTKLDGNQGWPNLDQAVEGAVKTETNTSHDPAQTQVLCAHCGVVLLVLPL